MGAPAPARAVGLRPLHMHDSLAYLFGVGAGGSRGLLRGRARGRNYNNNLSLIKLINAN